MRTTHAASVLGRWHVSLLWLGTGLCVLVLAWLVMRQPTLGFLLAIPVIAIVLGITLFFGWDGVLSLKRVVSVLIWVAILFPPLRRLPGELLDVRPEFILGLASGPLGTGEDPLGIDEEVDVVKIIALGWVHAHRLLLTRKICYAIVYHGGVAHATA